jgi:hypothetical protein
MSLERNIYSVLSADSGVTAICSDRTYPSPAPQDVSFPYVVWQRIATVPLSLVSEPVGFESSVIQFSIVSGTYSEAHDLTAAVIAALDTVALADGGIGHPTDRRELVEFNDDSTPIFRHLVDFRFHQPT